MDKVRAMAMAQELRGRSIGGWAVEDYLGNGFSAVVLSATRSSTRAALKVIDPEMVERYGLEHQRARILREKSLQGHTHPHLAHALAIQQTGNESQTFFHYRTLFPRHQHLLSDDKKCYPCVRYEPSSISRAAHGVSSQPTRAFSLDSVAPLELQLWNVTMPPLSSSPVSA